jgi:hypothetical protein
LGTNGRQKARQDEGCVGGHSALGGGGDEKVQRGAWGSRGSQRWSQRQVSFPEPVS